MGAMLLWATLLERSTFCLFRTGCLPKTQMRILLPWRGKFLQNTASRANLSEQLLRPRFFRGPNGLRQRSQAGMPSQLALRDCCISREITPHKFNTQLTLTSDAPSCTMPASSVLASRPHFCSTSDPCAVLCLCRRGPVLETYYVLTSAAVFSPTS